MANQQAVIVNMFGDGTTWKLRFKPGVELDVALPPEELEHFVHGVLSDPKRYMAIANAVPVTPQGQRIIRVRCNGWCLETLRELKCRKTVVSTRWTGRDFTAVSTRWTAVKSLPPQRHLCILGNPGIGKNWLLNALLWCGINRMSAAPWTAFRDTAGRPEPIVLRDAEGWHYFGAGRYRLFREPLPLFGKLLPALFPGQAQRVIVLHDMKNALPWGEQHLCGYTNVLVIVASSPAPEHTKDFFKFQKGAQQVVVPARTPQKTAKTLTKDTLDETG